MLWSSTGYHQATTAVTLCSVGTQSKLHEDKVQNKQDCFLQKEARVCVSNAFVLEDSMFK